MRWAASWWPRVTSDLPAFWHVSQWWNEPIVYQKVILWTVLLETIGVAGSWGPLAGKTKPMMGGILYWARPGTIRLRPWRRVPFTSGNRRTWFDVALYLALIVSVIVALVLPGVRSDSLSAALPDNTSGLVNPALLIAPMVLLVLIGLRDKTIFLAARGEQYLPALFFFTVLPFVDMIIALKLLIVVVWVAAGVSKFGLHFTNVIPPMVSNSPSMPFKWLKRAHYRNFPNDLRPSHLASFMAHGPGTVVEIVAPLALLLSPWPWLTVIAVAIMVAFHLFIISTFPLAVPLEWNVLFAYGAIFLFLGFPELERLRHRGHVLAVADRRHRGRPAVLPGAGQPAPRPGVLPARDAAVRGQLGVGDVGVRARRRGEAEPGDALVPQPGRPADRLRLRAAVGGDLQRSKPIGWRSMHSQGRGLFSVLVKNLPDIDTRTVREAELVCNSLIGFNFGDGHLHNEDLIAAVQDEAQFAPGELVVVWVESQAIATARSSTTRSSTRHSA